MRLEVNGRRKEWGALFLLIPISSAWRRNDINRFQNKWQMPQPQPEAFLQILQSPGPRRWQILKKYLKGVGWGRGRHAWNLMSQYRTTKDPFWTMKWNFYQLGKVNDIWFSF